ncbi:MAG: hypothetical protein HC906_09175 [Bacteroidales bacterium]|nr:hypothetical protein [Bacteroidales bacterium]
MKLTENSIQSEVSDLRAELASVKNTLESIKQNSQDYIIRYNSDLNIEFASDSLCHTLRIPEKKSLANEMPKLVFHPQAPVYGTTP